MIDLDYMDHHLYDEMPFENGPYTKERTLIYNDDPRFISTTLQKFEVSIDTNYFISDLITSEYTFHQVVKEKIQTDKFEKGEFGTDTIFIWEFKVDLFNKKIVEIKYYAADEILGFIGGFFDIVMRITGVLMSPFALIEFTVNNSTKKEEIEL